MYIEQLKYGTIKITNIYLRRGGNIKSWSVTYMFPITKP